MINNIRQLVAVANKLDEIGLSEDANIVDELSEKTLDDSEVLSDLMRFISEDDAKRIMKEAK